MLLAKVADDVSIDDDVDETVTVAFTPLKFIGPDGASTGTSTRRGSTPSVTLVSSTATNDVN
ncbi:MAG: hypothetical protein ACREA9_20485, partial [Pyrinomonadaceae bacterium]